MILFAWTVSVCLWIIFLAHRAKNNGMFSWLHWQQGVVHTYIIIVHQNTTVQLRVKFNHTHCIADNNCYQPQSVHQSVSLWCCWSLPVTNSVCVLSSSCNSNLTANSCILTASQQEPTMATGSDKWVTDTSRLCFSKVNNGHFSDIIFTEFSNVNSVNCPRPLALAARSPSTVRNIGRSVVWTVT